MKSLSGLVRAMARRSRNAVTVALTGGGGIAARPIRHRLLPSLELRDVLAGRRVLVTGASSGIGRAVALRVAGAGGTAVLVARSQEKLDALRAEIEAHGGRALSCTADLSSAASAGELLSRLEAERVAIDVLVNNAGRSIRRPIHESFERAHDYERTMALNYFGSLRLILGLLPGMRARGRGHVINVSSAGVQMGTPLFSAYVASKAALDAFTRVAASETLNDGVRFTTVHMPLVRTPMIAPTDAYRDVPALTPEEAADLVLRPLLTHEKQLGTRIGNLFAVGHAAAPALFERMANFGLRLQASAL